MRRCTMMAHLRLRTLCLMVMPACRRASRRPSNAARSCARRGPARNVLFCLQTLKHSTLTHPSLWEDYCFNMDDGGRVVDEGLQQGFAASEFLLGALALCDITDRTADQCA